MKKLSNQEYVEFTLVLNEDELSFSESLLIKKEMDELGFRLSNIIINKAQDELKLQAKKYLKFQKIQNLFFYLYVVKMLSHLIN